MSFKDIRIQSEVLNYVKKSILHAKISLSQNNFVLKLQFAYFTSIYCAHACIQDIDCTHNDCVTEPHRSSTMMVNRIEI